MTLKKKPSVRYVGVRLDTDLYARVCRHLRRLNQTVPGSRVCHAIGQLLVRGLVAEESESAAEREK
jgi:hypothetical protein